VLQDDPDDPTRTAIRQVLGVFAELDRKTVVKRLGDGGPSKAAEASMQSVSRRRSLGATHSTPDHSTSTPNRPVPYTQSVSHAVGGDVCKREPFIRRRFAIVCLPG
jgi:hypothetical protein